MDNKETLVNTVESLRERIREISDDPEIVLVVPIGGPEYAE